MKVSAINEEQQLALNEPISEADPKTVPGNFASELAKITDRLLVERKKRKSLQEAMKSVETELLNLFGATFISVYQCIDNGKDITAVFKGGKGSDIVEKTKILLPLSTTSVSGYVALSHKSLCIKDVYDEQELKKIHEDLKFDRRYSESRDLRLKSMIVIPIKQEILLGVLQLINLEGDKEFTPFELKRAATIAHELAKIFRKEFQSTLGPFDYLVQQGKITGFDLEGIEKSCNGSKAKITRKLLDEYDVSEDDVGRSLELYYRVPYMPFDSDLQLDPHLIKNIKSSYLEHNRWLPLESGGSEEAVILIDDPSDFSRIMEIQSLLKVKKIEIRVGLEEHIKYYINKDLADISGKEAFGDVFKSLQEEKVVVEEALETNELNQDGSSSSAIIRLVNKIIVEANKLNGSDIHIEPGQDKSPGTVRVRVDGECAELLKIPGEHTAAVLARIKVMSRLDISERRKPQDGKCKLKIGKNSLELRVATVPTVNGESAVLRILAAGSAMPIDKLMLSDKNFSVIDNMCSKPHGLILVVGPTGSGKTTTLHAVLGHMNKPNKKIWTAEDPVEITQPGLQQVQVQPKIGFTFADAMRSFLRADPDIILIGEMRDKETAAIGVEASLTGHLVLSTLHTNSAPETITRLLDLGLDPVNFSDALLCILAQRLLRTLCADCKEPYTPEKKEIDHLIEQYGCEEFPELGIERDEVQLYRAVGCAKCGDLGYRGRIGVHEVLTGTPKLQSMIYKNAELEEIRAQAVIDGMRTLQQDGIAKIFMGLSDYSQLLNVTAE
jgi:type II secretory ATPase GspE/PulE/Tfp pilus assembly ATPase PilB-like protein